MKNKKGIFFLLFSGLLTGAVITLFLSGKIIEYPRGTKEGGAVAGLGVAVIVSVSLIIIAVVAYLSKRKNIGRHSGI